MKIILLDYQNNYVGRSSWNVKTFYSIAHHAWIKISKLFCILGASFILLVTFQANVRNTLGIMWELFTSSRSTYNFQIFQQNRSFHV